MFVCQYRYSLYFKILTPITSSFLFIYTPSTLTCIRMNLFFYGLGFLLLYYVPYVHGQLYGQLGKDRSFQTRMEGPVVNMTEEEEDILSSDLLMPQSPPAPPPPPPVLEEPKNKQYVPLHFPKEMLTDLHLKYDTTQEAHIFLVAPCYGGMVIRLFSFYLFFKLFLLFHVCLLFLCCCGNYDRLPKASP